MVRAGEWLGVALNLAYTYMYLQGTLPLAYAFAAAGGLALGWACWHHRLQAETALHGFYVVMAGYGAWLASDASWAMTSHGWLWHAPAIALGLLACVWVAPWPLRRGAAMPRLDAFTTFFSVMATWWMVQGDEVNWLYWIVIDSLSVYLYAKRGMPVGALLFVVYDLMAIDGWFDAVRWFSG